MNKICLSHYAADKIKAAREQRESDFRAKQRQHAQVRDSICQEREQAGSKFIAAAKNGEIFSATGGLFNWLFAYSKVIPLAPVCAEASIVERKYETGIFGEDLVERHIEAQVDAGAVRYDYDDFDNDSEPNWVTVSGKCSTSISGFRGRKGEVDLIIVSLWGITAIEVKNVPGHVYTRGRDWFRDTYSDSGYMYAQGIPIKDRGGRGPAQQLAEAADDLQAMLKRNGQDFPVRRVVVLAHPDGAVGDIEFGQDHIDLVANVAQLDLIEFLESRVFANSRILEERDIPAVTELILAEHARINRPPKK